VLFCYFLYRWPYPFLDLSSPYAPLWYWLLNITPSPYKLDQLLLSNYLQLKVEIAQNNSNWLPNFAPGYVQTSEKLTRKDINSLLRFCNLTCTILVFCQESCQWSLYIKFLHSKEIYGDSFSWLKWNYLKVLICSSDAHPLLWCFRFYFKAQNTLFSRWHPESYQCLR
jgi:hypothetical protein